MIIDQLITNPLLFRSNTPVSPASVDLSKDSMSSALEARNRRMKKVIIEEVFDFVKSYITLSDQSSETTISIFGTRRSLS